MSKSVCAVTLYTVCSCVDVRASKDTRGNVDVEMLNTHTNNDGDKAHTVSLVFHGICVCVFQHLGILVKTHTFLNKHMWLIFIAPALTSPWQPTLRGGISDNHSFLSEYLLHERTTETHFVPRSCSHLFFIVLFIQFVGFGQQSLFLLLGFSCLQTWNNTDTTILILT